MSDTEARPEVLVKVRLSNEVTLSWEGDVEFYVTDETIVVYDYGARARDPLSTGLVFAAVPGQWFTAWRGSASQVEPK